MAIIQITDLHLRTIIGINDWERREKQDILINILIEYDATKAAKSDKLQDTIDYKAITKEIIKKVEESKYKLLEKLVDMILGIVLKHPLVEMATVKVDKPQALRFARSVSVELTKRK